MDGNHHSFLWPFGPSVASVIFQTRNRVTPGVVCHSSHPAVPSISLHPRTISLPSLCSPVWVQTAWDQVENFQSPPILSFISPLPLTLPTAVSCDLTCVDFTCLAPSCHCLFLAHKFISLSEITFSEFSTTYHCLVNIFKVQFHWITPLRR